ncbi:hypothetical protein A1704_02070 [Chryseobacterium cucumeris]|nr:hypothetical protein A1704_02070 [Chryseobacterium cucumeris]
MLHCVRAKLWTLFYRDAYQLKWKDIKEGHDGGLWIMNSRHKSNSQMDISLLPKVIEIFLLKEIADIYEIPNNLNTHKFLFFFSKIVFKIF